MARDVGRQHRFLTTGVGAVLAVGLVTVPAVAADRQAGEDLSPRHGAAPGAPGVGDPYFPLDGNGGYDVAHYDLDLRYDPAVGLLHGRARIVARATARLSAFDLDLVGLTVRAVTVDGRPASWTRDGQELTVVPRRHLDRQHRFTVQVTYDGVPELLDEPALGASGFFATDDGFDIAGQPHGAATWFPVNDHPVDKASYSFDVTVPKGTQAVANGDLVGKRTRGPWTTWSWEAPDPMASYLATVDVGRFSLTSYRRGGIRFLDAIDPDLFAPVAAPSTGSKFVLSQAADNSYKRLARTITVPAGGASVGFTVTRHTEQDWDFVFVEAHTVGQDDWTTLRDLNGHTSQDTGNSCLVWPDLHPFISSHYQVVDQDTGSCSPAGATGAWWAATGKSDAPEQWRVDLTPFADRDVELSISYASDDAVQSDGVYVDDIDVSTGQGSTSFEDGLDGWSVPGPPEGSPGNDNDWVVGTAANVGPGPGAVAAGSFAREPEILRFLSHSFGRYPWRSAGGIVDDIQGLGFALETQTRPVYSPDFFTDPQSGDGVVVHELAHQWYGDSLAVRRWRNIWLNEGFASYAEWLWSEHEGLGTAQDLFDAFASVPADYPGWQLRIGDPGPGHLFDYPVYFRGAMTLHTLRLQVGDDTFFRILRTWARNRSGQNVATWQFIALAERLSGQDLHPLFRTWLFTPGKPEGLTPVRRRETAPPAVQAMRDIAKHDATRRR